MTPAFGALPGRYRLQVTDELLAFIEQAFVAPLAEAARDAAREEARAEAYSSELELGPDGDVVSRAASGELARLRVDSRGLDRLELTKPNGSRVTIERIDEDRLRVLQPGKPAVEFLRVV